MAISAPKLDPRGRKVKILATVGPASRSPEMLARLFKAGVDAFRVNMSHGEHPDHAQTIETIRALEKKFMRVLFNGNARDAKYREMAKLTALAMVLYFPAMVSAIYRRLPSEEERVEATFAQALALLGLFFVASIFIRAVVYPLASRVCAGRATAVEPDTDYEGVQ